MTDAALQLHPDRLLPADPTTRGIARRLYAAVRDLPIISPHGHVPPDWIADDVPFGDPTSLLISPDHYVTRLLHANGVPLDEPRRRRHRAPPDGARAAWRALCTHWDAFRGTPSRFWLESELADIFGVTVRPSAATADAIYDQVAETLRRPDFRPRALLRALRHRGAGHHRRPVRRPGPPRGHPRRRRGRRPGCCRPSAPTATWSRAAPTGRELVDALGARGRHRHRRLQGLHRRAGGPAPVLRRARRRLRRPQPRRRRHRPAGPGRRRADLRGGPCGHGDAGARPPRCAATCCWRWRGCRSTTAWS